MHRHLCLALMIAALLTPCLSVVGQEPSQEEQMRRGWICHATIFLTGTSHQYTPPSWGMSGGILVDREKKCRKHIEMKFLTGSIWNRFDDLSCDEQHRVCRRGATFRVEYGFDKRPKSWSFTQALPSPPCDCELSCRPGYDLDITSDPHHPRCGKVLCTGAAAGIPNERFGPHDDGIGIWGGNVYHHQPVQRGTCNFARSNCRATWTAWLDRDNPSGSGDWEMLKSFAENGQACDKPLEIECRRVGTTKLVTTGLTDLGERIRCDVKVGGICRDDDQAPGVSCSDYEVRFLCP